MDINVDKVYSLDRLLNVDYVGFGNILPIGKRLSLFPPKVVEGGRYTFVSTVSHQYIKMGVSSLLVGGGVSLNNLIDYAIRRDIYVNIVPLFNLFESLGGLYKNNLLIEIGSDGVKPYNKVEIGEDKLTIYMDFLVRFSETPRFISIDLSVDAVDKLRRLVLLALDLNANLGAGVIYWDGSNYRLRLWITRRGYRLLVDELGEVLFHEIDVYSGYDDLVDFEYFRDIWGVFYLNLLSDIELGSLLINEDVTIYFGDLVGRNYVVVSKSQLETSRDYRCIEVSLDNHLKIIS